MADAMPYVVKQSPGFKLHAGLRREMMNGLQLIEEHKAEFADMLGVALIVIEASTEGASSGEYLASVGIVAMRFLARESVASGFLEQTFANANTGNDEAPHIQEAA